MTARSKILFSVIGLAATATVWCVVKWLPDRSTFETSSIVLDGVPRGGEVELRILGTSIVVKTSTEEPIRHLAEQLAAAVNVSSVLKKQSITASAKGPEVKFTNVAEFDLSLCTTDAGLRVPRAPMDFRCSVAPDGRSVLFAWNNPETGYDRIHIVAEGVPVVESLPGTCTTFVWDRSKGAVALRSGNCVVSITGVLRGLPSCSAQCAVML
jgi:hypothetical protein